MYTSVMKIQIMNQARNLKTSYASPTVKAAANVANMTTNTSFTARAKTPFSRA